LKRIYDGPAVSIDFKKPEAVAGITFRVYGNITTPVTYQAAVRTATGETVVGSRTLNTGWVAGGQLFPILPAKPAITGTGITVSTIAPLKAMTVWAVDNESTKP
jgi:hypothetical protein